MPDEAQIFVSHRRADGQDRARLLAREMTSRSPGIRAFVDVDSISPGTNWRESLQQALRGCTVVLVVVTKAWLGADGRRLFDPEDWVAFELRAAQSANLFILPVIDADVPPPKREDLPADLAWFADLQVFPMHRNLPLTDVMDRLHRLVQPHLRRPISTIEVVRRPSVTRRSRSTGSVIGTIFGVVVLVTALAIIGPMLVSYLKDLWSGPTNAPSSGSSGTGSDGSPATPRPSPSPTVVRGSWSSDDRLQGVSFTATKVVRTETGVTVSLKAHNGGSERFEFRWDAEISAQDDKDRQFTADQFGALFDQHVDPGGSLNSKVDFPGVTPSSRRLTVTFSHTEHGFKDTVTRVKIKDVPVPR